MGRDKATIEIDRVPILRRIYDAVAACAHLDRIYVVTPWVERYRSILPADCNFIIEQQPHQGPFIAFSQALSTINSTWVLLLACDLPNLSTPVIQSWIDRLPSIDSQSIAYLPRHPTKGWEPLCGCYRQNCHASAIEYIHNGGQSFQGWLNENLVAELAITDPRCIANCNTPTDLETLLLR
jgi:molybdenum cofactor guanylyltransferase